MLQPYLGRPGSRIYKCPEFAAGGAAPAGMEQLYQFHCYHRNGTEYYLDLDGPYVVKMSDTQYRNANLRHGRNVWDVYSAYEEDSNPEVVWYCMEEAIDGVSFPGKQGGNAARDYEDTRLRVTDNGDGTVNLYFDLGSGAINVDLIPYGGGAAVLHAGDNSEYGSWQNRHNQHPVGSCPGGVAEEASYGMNVKVSSLRGGGKILAIDYIWSVASAAHKWSDHPHAEVPSLPMFARHNARMNVLFLGGGVRLMRPDEIDPIGDGVPEAYWLP